MRVFYFFDPGPIDVANNDFGVLGAILEKKRIKISRISRLNDPFDLQVSFPNKYSSDYIKGFRNTFDNKVGIISFSTDIYNILMWSHYAAKHQGYALELELDQKRLSRVNYSLFAPEVIRESKDSPNYKNAIKSVLRTKALDWAYEKEWRMILFYSRDKTIQEETTDAGEIVRFFPLPVGSLKSIFIGLRCEAPRNQLRTKLEGWNLGDVAVYKMEQDKTGYSLVCPEFDRVRSVQQFVKSFCRKR